MVIHLLTPRVENGELTIAARVEWTRAQNNFPPTLWFKFPEAQVPLVSERGDGFAIALLSPALYRGEDIQVRGTMSAAVAFGLREFARVQCLRLPGRYKPVQIHADAYAPSERKDSKAASTFSGGVDSFYTVWSHISQNEPLAGAELAYAILVQGFDIGLHDRYTFETCREAYQKLMQGWGLELLTATTNVRRFDQPSNWVEASSFAVIALGHLLSRGLARYYVPANETYENMPNAVATLAHTLLSSESLQIVTDGARLTRFEKIVALAHVPAAHAHLRTCSDHPDGLLNCCRCGRCLNVMAALELCGTLQNFKTFPLSLDRGKLRRSYLAYSVRNVLGPFIKGALERGRYDLAFDLSVKLLLNYLGWGPKWVRRKVQKR